MTRSWASICRTLLCCTTLAGAAAVVLGQPATQPAESAPAELEGGEKVALPPGMSTGAVGESQGGAAESLEAGGRAAGSPAESSEPVGAGGIATTNLDAVDLPTLFGEAVVHYQEGRYAQAVDSFERFLRLGPDNATAHYNLGNALLRNGELGRAIASYRRARARAPRDEDVRANLQFARTSARDALEVPDAGPAARTLAFWHYSFSTVERVWLAVLCNIMFWLGLGWAKLTRDRPGRAGAGLAAVAAVLLVAIGGSLVVEWWQGEPVAVVLPAEVDVRTAPREDSVVRFKLHAGSEVRLESERPGWVQVELPDGERGWLEESFVERSV